MKAKDELSVILILDYNERNTQPYYTPLAIVDSADEEMVRTIIAHWLGTETNLSDDDGNDFLDDCVPTLVGDNFYQDDDYKVAFKIESALYYTKN